VQLPHTLPQLLIPKILQLILHHIALSVEVVYARNVWHTSIFYCSKLQECNTELQIRQHSMQDAIHRITQNVSALMIQEQQHRLQITAWIKKVMKVHSTVAMICSCHSIE
jgi:hypothetical protein